MGAYWKFYTSIFFGYIAQPLAPLGYIHHLHLQRSQHKNLVENSSYFKEALSHYLKEVDIFCNSYDFFIDYGSRMIATFGRNCTDNIRITNTALLITNNEFPTLVDISIRGKYAIILLSLAIFRQGL